MEGSMDAFDTVNSELRKRKIEKREQRGYAAGPITWQSHKRQKFHCRKCKRSFPRMEILLQHFRDCSRHSGEAVSTEASVQMSDWLLAKDQKQHCCPTCCLGFKTEPELFVHLKHTAVHQGTSEAQQAASLLLPKDEARLMRRDLPGSAAGSDSLFARAMPWAEHVQSLTRFDKAQTQAGDSCTQTWAGDSCTQTWAGDSCTQTQARDGCTQTQAGDSCTQAGEQVQLPKADAQTDAAVNSGEQLSEDNAQTEAVLDRTGDGTSVGLAESGSTLPEASLRPLQRRVVAKKRKRITLLFTSNPIAVHEDKSESTLTGTDNVEMAIIEPQMSNQTDTDDAGKRSRKEKKLARRESRPVKISWQPNKITFAFG